MKTQLVFLLAIIALAARFDWPRSPEQDRLECKVKVKAIGTADEMYSNDNALRYPDSLHRLEGRYLKKLPTCPTTGSDYSESYRVVTSPDTYFFGCRGRHHGDPRRIWVNQSSLMTP